MSNNNIVTKSDLGEFYGKILPYLNGQVPIHLNQFDKSNLYSTEEKMIGQWTDGRPVYQKTINCGAMPNNTEKTIAHSISNLRNFVSVSGVFINGTTSGALPQATADTALTNQVGMYADGTYVRIATRNDLSAFTAYVTLQYTKTTDSALPVRYSDANDYSTTEQIVGTWIDGKPLYQKTFSFGTLTNAPSGATTTKKSIGATVDTVVSVTGFWGGNGWFTAMPYQSANGDTTIYPSIINNSGPSNKNTVYLEYTGDLSWVTASCVTLQYTKTT